MNVSKTNQSNLNGIHYESQGEGPPVILIHGMGASLRNWIYLSPYLVSKGYRAYAIDLPGHGDSVKWQEPENYHVDLLFKAFEHWVKDVFNDSQVTLIGHSLGAYLGVRYTLNNPEKVHSLILVDPFLSKNQLSPFLKLGLRHPYVGARVLELTPQWIIQPIVNMNRNISANLSRDIRHQMADDYKRATHLIVHITPTVENLVKRLGEIQNPTLITWGEKDRTLSTNSFHAAVEELPNGHGYPIPGIGHTPHLCAAPVFNQIVTDFISSTS